MKKMFYHFISVFFLLIPFTHAQDIATVKSNLVVDGTNTYFPYDTLNYFTVTGRVTSPFLSFTNTTEIFIQDATAGIRVHSVPGLFGLETNNAVFQLGVEVTVFGKIAQTNGLRSIRPEIYTPGNYFDTGTDFYISDTNPIPVSPEVVTISNFLAAAEDYEGKLIRINSVTTPTNAWAYKANSTLTITDATGSVNFFIDQDTNIDGQQPPTNTFDMIGIASQFTSASVPSNGYQIMPRYYSDIVQTVGEEPPSISVTTNATAVANAPFTLNMVGQDRNAEDVLVLTTNQSPTGSLFTDYGNREATFTWTPSISDEGTTNLAIFQVTDGTSTNTVSVSIVVRPASGGPGFAWINEFHYDNTGIDTNEGVELAGEAGIDLSSYYILYYDGNLGNTYASNACSGTIDDEGNGYGAVWFSFSNSQNGSPDGIALVHQTNGLLQFLSYEGIFTPSSGPAAGIASVDVAVFEESSTAIDLSLQLVGNGTNYEAFTWSGPMTATRGDLNGSTQIIIDVVDANVTLTSLTLNPTAPATNETFDIRCTIAPNYTASNLVATAFYSLNGGTTSSISMTDSGGGVYQTDSQISAQPEDTIISYFVSSTFDGPGTNSPQFSTTNSYTFHTAATGAVIALINEVRCDGNGTDTNEFIEIIAPAGMNLENCSIIHYNGSDSSDSDIFAFTFPNITVPNDGITDTNGTPLGFIVLSQISNNVANTDLVLPADMQNGPDGLVLYDRNSNVLDAVAWSGAGDMAVDDPGTVLTNGYAFASNYLHVTSADDGTDNSLQPPNNVVGAYGSEWITGTATPGLINSNQTSGNIIIIYEGGGTNLPPTLTAIGNKTVLEGGTLQFSLSATDVDDDTITFSVSNAPAGSTFVSNTFTWTNASPGGVYTSTFYAVDDDGSDSETITITAQESSDGTNCNMIVSEYLEGSSNNKAVELYNGSASAIDLSAGQYFIVGYNNGGTTITYTIALTGTVASGDTYVIGHSSANATIQSLSDQLGTVNFSGDDAFVLRSGGSNGVNVDVFGEVGFDPGSAWGTGTNTTGEHTLRRKAAITSGDTIQDDDFDPSIEWDFYPQDTTDGLGVHTMNCESGTDDDDSDGLPNDWETQHFGGSTNATAIADDDSDGFDNLSEYVAGTEPTNGASLFDINALSNLTSRVIVFDSVTGRNYSIDFTTNLLLGDGWINLQSNVAGLGGVMTLSDTNNTGQRVYRLGVELP